ncbi:hypothetical protein ACG83_35095 [Frankia sp. R43]|nr:hypothetical protein ACG83_35095 [Frankia sp. R43]
MAAMTADVGHPHSAGVGCGAAARRSDDTDGSARQPPIRVDGCHLVVVRTRVGAAGRSSPT